MNIREKLKQFRTEKGWSQERLARELDYSVSSVNKWESEKSKKEPGKKAIEKLKSLGFRG